MRRLIVLLAVGLGVGLGSWISPAVADTASRIQGADRYATAATAARATFTQASTAVVARGDQFPDALAASFLAGSFNGGGPIILTTTSSLPVVSREALASLGVRMVYIVGDESAVGAPVEAELRGLGIEVTRLGAESRYGTAELIAAANDENIRVVEPMGRVAYLASGQSFADALAAAPIAYRESIPVLLTMRESLPVESQRALQQRRIDHVYVLGGNAAVATAVEVQVATLGITTERIAGATRTSTAAAVARHATAVFGWTPAHVNLTRGDGFADAIAAGPHGGVERAPTLLTTSPTVLSEATRAYLEEQRAHISSLHAFGDTTAVSDATFEDARNAAS